jgi:phage terminase large subunit GpA-like protein
MMIESVGVDSGGHNTQAVYHYCRSHAHAHVLALKGSSQPNRPVIGKPSAVDVNWRGKTQPRSLKLWLVGVDTAKHLIYGRLRMHQPGPGYIHLPEALKAGDEFEQLTAERLATKYIKGHAKLEWFKPAGKRNEALDCAVYAYAMACYLGAQSMREPAWAKREERIAPKEPDLFAMAAAPAANQSADAGKPIKNHIEQPLDMVKQPNPYLNRPRQKGPSRQW